MKREILLILLICFLIAGCEAKTEAPKNKIFVWTRTERCLGKRCPHKTIMYHWDEVELLDINNGLWQVRWPSGDTEWFNPEANSWRPYQ